MIDYFALFLGHGLLVLVCWRLFMGADTDIDPVREEQKAARKADREVNTAAGRAAARRAAAKSDEEATP